MLFRSEATRAAHADRVQYVAKFLNWLSPLNPITKDDQRFLGLLAGPSQAAAGAVVVHGMGVHPDWELIGVLRSRLAEQGYRTLSVQMPVLAADAKGEDYPALFGDAAERLADLVVPAAHLARFRPSAIRRAQGNGAGLSPTFPSPCALLKDPLVEVHLRVTTLPSACPSRRARWRRKAKGNAYDDSENNLFLCSNSSPPPNCFCGG